MTVAMILYFFYSFTFFKDKNQQINPINSENKMFAKQY